jgi:hypothetical protein
MSSPVEYTRIVKLDKLSKLLEALETAKLKWRIASNPTSDTVEVIITMP